MPHLAPFSWALAPIIFWVILLSLATSIWWSPSIIFPHCSKPSSSSPFSSWNWA